MKEEKKKSLQTEIIFVFKHENKNLYVHLDFFMITQLYLNILQTPNNIGPCESFPFSSCRSIFFLDSNNDKHPPKNVVDLVYTLVQEDVQQIIRNNVNSFVIQPKERGKMFSNFYCENRFPTAKPHESPLTPVNLSFPLQKAIASSIILNRD